MRSHANNGGFTRNDVAKRLGGAHAQAIEQKSSNTACVHGPL